MIVGCTIYGHTLGHTSLVSSNRLCNPLFDGPNLDIVHGSLAGQTFLTQVVYERPRQNFAYETTYSVKFGISHLQLVNEDY